MELVTSESDCARMLEIYILSPTPQSKYFDPLWFDYAYTLAHRENKAAVHTSIELLRELLTEGNYHRDYLLILAFALYKTEQLQESRDVLNQLLSREPNFRQARELREKVEDRMRKDGLLGAGIIAGVGAALAFGIFKIVTRNKQN